jgi:sec-independent protein translocase protein TatA
MISIHFDRPSSMPSTSSTLAFIDGLGGGEMILIFFVILLLFGGQRLPELARGLGKSIREFKKATSGVENEIKRVLDEPSPPPRPAPKKPLHTVPLPVIEPITPIDSLETPPISPPAASKLPPSGSPPPPDAPAV